MGYSKLIITNLPAFYKINLYNEINKKDKIFVIFTGEDGVARDSSFFKANIDFEYINLASLSKVKKMLKIIRLINKIKFREFIIGGWNQPYYWLGAFVCRKKKNAMVVESSNFESVTGGAKGFIKRLFLSRISKVYVSGQSQADLVTAMKFSGKIVKTGGVGIANRTELKVFKEKSSVNKFLYVGRLSAEKNLDSLISVFNGIDGAILTIIGYGSEENYLKEIAGSNINFLGTIDNTELPHYFKENDVFVLPSISEPWGLVIEEAFQNGLPVIVSNRVGCAPEIVTQKNGLIFDLAEPDDLKENILKMMNIDFYNRLSYNVSRMNFEEIATKQVDSYLR